MRREKTSKGGVVRAGRSTSTDSGFHLTGILSCITCGRSGGNLLADRPECTRCRAQMAPTALQSWREATGLSVEDVAAAAGLVPFTVQRALRGEPMGPTAAASLSELTGIPVEELMMYGSQEEV